MKIGIDARMYSQSGIGRYTCNLIKQLQKLDSKNEYYIFLLKEEFDSLTFQKNFHKVLADISWYSIAEQVRFPRLLNTYQLDLVHFPHFNVPIFYSGKFIVTIHDLIHQHFQMQRVTTHGRLVYRLKQIGYKTVFQYALKHSSAILTPSNFVKSSLAKEWAIGEDRITVTHEAVDEDIVQLVKKMTFDKSSEIIEDLGVAEPFLFYMGNAHPHKNIEGLIATFLDLQKKYPQLSLVLSGNDHYFWRRIQTDLMQKGLDQHIRFTGYITDTQAVALYSRAVCFVLPSFEEGFGIPVLEAFICKCPVVCSNNASMPEVAGNAVIFFDPKNKKEMNDSIEKILRSEKLRQELIKKGEKRCKEFNWENLAKQTLKIYMNV